MDQSREDLAWQIKKAKLVGEMFTISADLLASLSPRDKDFLDGRQIKIELPKRLKCRLPPLASEAKELLQSALTDPSYPSVSELSRKIGYRYKLCENIQQLF